MKSMLVLLLVLLWKLPAGVPPKGRVVFSPLTKAAYLEARKLAVVTKPRLTFPVKKVQGRIVVPTAKGPKVFADIVVDEAAVSKGHSEAEMTTYTYLGYLADFKYHLVRAQYYETTQWLLIAASGRQVELWGEPVFGPDTQHIAATCAGIEYGGGQPNSIQLLELRNGVLQEVWKLEPKDWEPYQIAWTSANTFLLNRVMWTGKNPGNTQTYSKLTIAR